MKKIIINCQFNSVFLRVLRGRILTTQDTEEHGVDCYMLFIFYHLIMRNKRDITVNKVSSLRDLAEMEPHSDRKLKHTVNKMLSLRDKPCNTVKLCKPKFRRTHIMGAPVMAFYCNTVKLCKPKSRRDGTLLTVCFSLRTERLPAHQVPQGRYFM